MILEKRRRLSKVELAFFVGLVVMNCIKWKEHG